MPLFKYFTEQAFAEAFMRRGTMRFGSLVHYRGLEDGGVRGDARDGTLHYAPPEGLEITMVSDGRKLTGTSFTTAAENMYIFCLSDELSADRARDFGEFCVEITEPDRVISRLKGRASRGSQLDYANVIYGCVDYRPLDKIPGTDWAFPERVVLTKPPEYSHQREFRIALPLKPSAYSSDRTIDIQVGSLQDSTRLHRF